MNSSAVIQPAQERNAAYQGEWSCLRDTGSSRARCHRGAGDAGVRLGPRSQQNQLGL